MRQKLSCTQFATSTNCTSTSSRRTTIQILSDKPELHEVWSSKEQLGMNYTRQQRNIGFLGSMSKNTKKKNMYILFAGKKLINHFIQNLCLTSKSPELERQVSVMQEIESYGVARRISPVFSIYRWCVSFLKRRGEEPKRMFAGEGGPAKTNTRFHFVQRRKCSPLVNGL